MSLGAVQYAFYDNTFQDASITFIPVQSNAFIKKKKSQ